MLLFAYQRRGAIMIHLNRSFMIVVLLLLFSGCATMIRGTEEKLDITSEPSGSLVELSNGEKGQTPCQFTLKRNQTIILKFTKEGYQPESLTVCPTLAGAGVILGGVIDYGTGAVYSLTPNPAHVILNPVSASSPIVEQPEKPQKSVIQELDELDRLNKEGKISDSEYKIMKQKLIDNYQR
jgi:hypothetical protein